MEKMEATTRLLWAALWVLWWSVATQGSPQRCNKGNKVCQKLEKDDPVFGGQRCEVPSDCKDEYNPYCSKWGKHQMKGNLMVGGSKNMT